ncbi:ferrichrome ABC transporter, ATP-binding protein, partial [gut metagenome]
MIELFEASAGYNGQNVLNSVTLNFKKSTVTVLLGPNGCGKSTLLKTALGLLPLSSGEVLYDGKNIQGLSPKQIAQKAAYLSQSRSVPNITASRMVMHGRFPYLGYPRRYGPKDYETVCEALKTTGSIEMKDRHMSELSGGQRQKVYV